MLKSVNIFKTAQNKRGATSVIVAICLIMLIGFAALAIDVGYLYTTRNELQNIADAAALAGAGYLGSEYETLSYSEQQTKTFDFDEVADVVKAVAIQNKAATVNISIANADIIIGNWNGSSVDQTLTGPDAVHVTARRNSTINTAVSTFFARIFKVFGTNFDTVSVSARATAALTGTSEVDPGELKVPFSISENVMLNCTNLIAFSPTTDSCAGWHNFGDLANASKMADNLLGIIQAHDCGGNCGTSSAGNPLLKGADWLAANFELVHSPDPVVTGSDNEIPGFQSGMEIDHSGGTISSLFTGAILDPSTDGGNGSFKIFTDPSANPKIPAQFQALFDYFRYRDGDSNWEHPVTHTPYDKDQVWTTTVPVYEDLATCINPSGDEKILYFVDIKVIMPNPPPDSTVSVYVDCNQSYTPGRGGGSMGPLKGTIPNLVE